MSCKPQQTAVLITPYKFPAKVNKLPSYSGPQKIVTPGEQADGNRVSCCGLLYSEDKRSGQEVFRMKLNAC